MRQIENLEAEIEELETQSQAISEQMLKPTMPKSSWNCRLNWIKLAIVKKKLMLEWEELSEQV